MRLHILFRNGVLGVALAGLMVTGASAQAQDKDAAKDTAKAQKDATKDAAKAQKDAVKDAKVKKSKVKKDKDRDPSASTDKTKGKHKAIGHSH